MKNLILTSVVTIAITLLASCGKNQHKEQERLKFTQDSLKTDNAFQFQIASLTTSIDSLLPYSKRKQFRDSLNKGYKEMFLEEVKERKAELGYSEADYNSSLSSDVVSSIRYELEQNGYGQKYLEKEYLDWARMHSKNPIMQEFLEKQLDDAKWRYQNFKNGIR